jgi:hypothetical protein
MKLFFATFLANLFFLGFDALGGSRGELADFERCPVAAVG